MTEQIDQAQELDQLFRDRALASHNNKKHQEIPDEDESGKRYCLDCGDGIPSERIVAQPCAVRCVQCQAVKERGWIG